MTKSVLEFDEIAADDALIEAIRSGAAAADLPGDDPAPPVLLALRDGADLPAEDGPAATSAGLGTMIRHRRVLASGVAACMLAVAGVGTAVAGDPTAAFRYMFREGVDLGSRFGSPAEDHARAPFGGGDHIRPPEGASKSPVRQGSAAAPWSDDRGTREPFGYEKQSQTWDERMTDDLDSFADSDRSTIDTEGDDQLDPDDSWQTSSPEVDDRPTPEVQSYGPDSDDSDGGTDESDESEQTGPTEEYGPTYTGPTESSPTPTETSPTESSPTPTETSPTESSPTPTETSPTESSPTPTQTSPTSPTPSSPTTPTPSDPTSSPTPTQTPSSPNPTETSPTP